MDSAQIESHRKGVYYTLRVQTRPGVVEDWEGCLLDGVVDVSFAGVADSHQEYVKFQLAAAAPASMLLESHRIVELVPES